MSPIFELQSKSAHDASGFNTAALVSFPIVTY